MNILAIETSCDETAASVVKINPKTWQMKELSSIVSSQIDIHQKYGGVVPEIAAREHVLQILPVINEAISQAKIKPKQINYLAVTQGPGLITSLITGLETGRTLAFAWQKPIVAVNHIAGHLYANFLNTNQKIKFPAIILTVSGGHTNLVLMKKPNNIKIVGETLDDAAGEAYDKAAKMMGLGYPGGPIISQQAKAYLQTKNQASNLIFPRPLLKHNNLNFSFSGLKTALLYQLKKDKNWKKRLPEYCFAYQEAIIEVLIYKTLQAATKYKVKTIMLSGGVSANDELRQRLLEVVNNKLPQVKCLIPEKKYTTDNAAMIAAAGFFAIENNLKKKKTMTYNKLKVDPSWNL